MSVEKMKIVTIDGKFEKLDETLMACIISGCFQPETTSDYMSSGLNNLVSINEENPYKQPLDRLENYMEAFGIVPKFVETSITGFCTSDCETEIAGIEEMFGKNEDEKKALREEINVCKSSKEQLAHYAGIKLKLHDIFDCKFISVRFGRLPSASFQMLETYKDNPHIMFVPFSNDDDYYWGMYVVPKNAADEVDLIFAALFFERLRIPDAASTPQEAIDEFTRRQTAAEKRIEEIDTTLKKYWYKQEEHLILLYSQLTKLSQAFEIRKKAVRHVDHFMITGWVPVSEITGFKKLLSEIESVELTAADNKSVKKSTPPTKLKNPRFFNSYEFYVKMFGVPKYGEIDPTIFIALTYTLFYGIMFADLGQGFVLAAAGWLMYKYKGMELGRLLVPCGFSGAFFGLVFGSVFGFEELLNPLYKAVGFSEKPINVMESQNMMTLLIVAVGIGVVLMFTALLLGIYSMVKQKKFGSALFGSNGLTGLILYVGIILILLNSVLKLNIPSMPLVIAMIVVPVIFLWLKEPLENLVNGEKDWQPESWGEYAVQGFFEVFESLLSYVTNTVSFLRIGAFVLVHASMMMVFFSLAEMSGGAVGIILIVFGNIFVAGLEALLVGIQSLRLEFYEMFNRFYEGSGVEFKPASFIKQ